MSLLNVPLLGQRDRTDCLPTCVEMVLAYTVILNDPAFPDTPRQVPYDEFMLAWSDFDYLYAVIQLLD